ncbi:DUF6766 family protein [Sphingobacterium bambusae]|uniref:DUF6766 family protein n=1 Tax=Sphingobacterium bambusae TaxID=662858 RepID=A0ABW6B9L5_9SPHI|nr:DUF6766 family protein [Sphingobacterium bambusae]WPL48498.1 DUF6766 family protein [Sphingobacterium bambusae]
MKKSFIYKNSLSIVFLALFVAALFGQTIFGWKVYNSELADVGQRPLNLLYYLRSGHFISATFENFQSEFLQMMLYVVLTIFLRQIGSAESKKLNEKEPVDRDPIPTLDAPRPVRSGGWRLKLYKHSLSISFAFLFVFSWAMHLVGSFRYYNDELGMVNKPSIDLVSFISKPDFWFESLQNWQSEFLSVASIVILTIFLRQKGSPESKPVDAPHMETGK